jgi:hypothetical protein
MGYLQWLRVVGGGGVVRRIGGVFVWVEGQEGQQG